ncbi:DEAD-like helicases superfamily protein [Metarhizium robertsii]|uniref:RNA helicase n=2 Tax=Metarhizium robertsii TaxID=568076 RepID=E9F537_METRA|nr:RNA helicase, DEAD-box type, Q motif protein [Metarhizium robertsii ARSEF 23]EFY97090.1 RNA helicase, DEAD-box type, Q motif protein [Metarhizium robertsii ARSEF 23]EXV00617.1 DEAD-like helicases superfamily protein [Metarhizium robertsii]
MASQVKPAPAAPGAWVEPQKIDYSALNGDGSQAVEHFDGSAPIYQWNDDFGDVGPKFEALELELFGDPETRHDRAGLDFSKIEQISVEQEGPVRIQPLRTFKDAALHPVMAENIKLMGYDAPTPIQKYTIPSMLQGHDVIGIAQTGSGKTAAYLIPILSKLMGKAKKLAAPRPNPATYREGIDAVTAEPLVLVVAPTRELAVQIFNEARKFCYRSMLRPCVVYGGLPTAQQISLLSKGCDILVGTPGRLVDFISRPHILTLRRLKYMIIDEADEMLDSDWNDELSQVLSGGEQDEGNVKYGLFSATFPKAARDLAKDHLSAAHVRFRVGRAGSTTENIKQVILATERDEKRDTLLRLLNQMTGVRTIIFANSRREVDNLDDFLYNMGLPVTSMHSERTQKEREAALRSFRAGQAPILIATGVTARGIDVRNVMHVINYDLPSMEHGGIEEYTHRIGRTGRIGHRGLATSFFDPVNDDSMGSVLTRTLLETKQEVPEFLQVYVPEGDAAVHLRFETESDYDPAEAQGQEQANGTSGNDSWGGGQAEDTNGTGSGWGHSNTDAATSSAPANNGWGGEAAPTAPATTSNGWGGEAAPTAPTAPATSSNGWGGKAAPTAPAPANNGWGGEAAPTAPAATSNGWGAGAQTVSVGW